MSKLRFGLGVVAAFAVTSTMAFADGMPRGSIKDAPIGPTCAKFGGPYLGMHAGYDSTKHGWSDPNRYLEGVVQPGTGRSTSFDGGGQVGWNFQSPSSCSLFGIEADITKTNNTRNDHYFGPLAIDYGVKNSIDWFGTARIRAGIVSGSTLYFVSVGVGVVDTQHKINRSFAGLPQQSSFSENQLGLAASLGFEYQLSRNFSFKGEVMYIGLDDVKHIANGRFTAASPVTPFPIAFNNDHLLTARIGFNYLIGN